MFATHHSRKGGHYVLKEQKLKIKQKYASPTLKNPKLHLTECEHVF